MTVEQRRRSPLDGLAVTRPGVRIAESPFAAMVSLRTPDPDGPVAGVLGIAPPSVPNTVVVVGERAMLWLGPDEWLVLGPDRDGAALTAALTDAIGDAPGAAVDVSAHRTTVELTGERARELLEHGCPLDLHPRVFGPGRCAQTLLARSPVILWSPAEQSYRLLVRASFARYVADWLTDAAS